MMNARQKKAMTRRFRNFVDPTTTKIRNTTRMRVGSARKGYKKTERSFKNMRSGSTLKMKTQRSKYQMIGAESRRESVTFAYRA